MGDTQYGLKLRPLHMMCFEYTCIYKLSYFRHAWYIAQCTHNITHTHKHTHIHTHTQDAHTHIHIYTQQHTSHITHTHIHGGDAAPGELSLVLRARTSSLMAVIWLLRSMGISSSASKWYSLSESTRFSHRNCPCYDQCQANGGGTTKPKLDPYLAWLLLEKEASVELEFVLSARYHSKEHVVCHTVILASQLVQSLVTMEIFWLGLMTSPDRTDKINSQP